MATSGKRAAQQEAPRGHSTCARRRLGSIGAPAGGGGRRQGKRRPAPLARQVPPHANEASAEVPDSRRIGEPAARLHRSRLHASRNGGHASHLRGSRGKPAPAPGTTCEPETPPNPGAGAGPGRQLEGGSRGVLGPGGSEDGGGGEVVARPPRLREGLRPPHVPRPDRPPYPARALTVQSPRWR